MSTSDEFNEAGRIWFRRALNSEFLDQLGDEWQRSHAATARVSPGDKLAELVRAHDPFRALVQSVLPNAFPVRMQLFDKHGEQNWALPWHQDRVIAVKACEDVPGLSNWTRKPRYWHAEAPAAWFDKMVFARLHLDPSVADNGAMKLALGSHTHGRVSDQAVEQVVADCDVDAGEAQRGDVVVAHALMLHQSSASSRPERRRAIRIDYANFDLPEPLEWAWS